MKSVLLGICFTITTILSASNYVCATSNGFDIGLNLQGLAKDIVQERLIKHGLQIDETIQTVILQLRNESAIQIPGVDIPDPMFVPDLNITVNQGATNADVQLWNVTITGISEVILDQASADLSDMDIAIGLNMTELLTKGEYDLKGKFSFFRISGAGDFWMKVKDVYVTGNLFLGVNDEGILQVTDINLDLVVRDIQLQFDNLFGMMSGFGNAVLNALSPILFNRIKPTLLDEMQRIILTILNEKFQQLPPQPELVNSQVPLDLAIANTATQIREKGLDPFPLPNQQLYFNRRFLFIRLYGNLTLHDGYLSGLSSIRRTGVIKLSYKDNYGNATAHIGFKNFEGGYKWNIHFMGISRKGAVHFVVNEIDSLVVITQVNEKDNHPIVSQLKVSHIEQMGLDIDGLGSFDYLLEFFTNFFTNAFKKQFSRILETQVGEVLQENLKEFKIPF